MMNLFHLLKEKMQHEKALIASNIGINFGDNDDSRRIEVTLVGHEVVGGGYTGGLLCTGLTRWCDRSSFKL
jgi:hypothetical protein